MKKTALLMASAMSLTLIVPLAACGGSGKFDLNDYTVPTTHYEGEWTSATKLDEKYTFVEELGENTPVVVLSAEKEEDPNVYVLYNVETKQEVSAYFSDSTTHDGGYVVTTVTGASADEVTYDVYSFWGDTIETGIKANDRGVSCGGEGINIINGQAHNIYSVSYTTKVTQGEGKEVNIYFSLDKTSVTDEKPTLVKYTEEEFNAVQKEIASAGMTFDAVSMMRTVFAKAGQKGALDNYEYNSYSNVSGGTTYVFFKDGKQQKNELVLPSNAKLLTGSSRTPTPVGTSLIYSVTTDVDPYATKGYNVITDNGFSATKSFVEYFRYNVKNGKTSKLSTDFYINALGAPLYNYKDEEADVVPAQVVSFEKGVAHVGGSNEVTRTVLLNESGKVVCDLSDLPSFDGDIANITKLTDKRFLADGSDVSYLIDNKLNVIAALPQIEPEQISFSAERIMAGSVLVDFDGKVVSDNLYEEFVGFVGGKAIVANIYKSSTDSNPVDDEYSEGYCVAADGSYKKASEVFPITEENEPQIDDDTYSLAVVGTGLYNFEGTKLVDVATSGTPNFTFTYHNCAIVTVGTENFVVTR